MTLFVPVLNPDVLTTGIRLTSAQRRKVCTILV